MNDITTETPTPTVPTAKSTACLVDGCTRKVGSHGVCVPHYKMLLKMVRTGKTTWAELESKGISTPATFTRDPRDRELLDAFIKSKM
jgi:hypothetical protein